MVLPYGRLQALDRIVLSHIWDYGRLRSLPESDPASQHEILEEVLNLGESSLR